MQKLLLSLAFVCFMLNVHAQELPMTKVDSMLINIDKTTFTSGVLYDRVVPFARLRAFNDSTNVSRAKHFEQALHELYRASNKEKFFSYKTWRGFYTPDSLSNQTDIGVLNASFHTLNYVPDSTELGALRIVEGLFEKIDNERPPFLPDHVLVVSPTKRYLKAENGQPVIFHFTNDFLIQDTEGKNIVRLTANFDTANNYTLIENGNVVDQHISINYAEKGWKKLSFIAVFADDSQMTVLADVHVKILQSPPEDPIRICADLAFQGYYDPDETYPIKGCIEYRVFYHNGGNQLMKPIIIIDGFDPGDKRKILDTDSDLPPDDHTSIKEFMFYEDSQGVRQPIIAELDDLGYDVVLVNQFTYTVNKGQPNERTIDGGADYIERNARAHIKLYQTLNAKLVANNSTEELVIVGPSMGGQISRYALAYMEAHGMDHNTRLWVSVDSPHLGANIPLGLQSLLNQVADEGNTRAIDFVDNQLGSVAAQQQLIEQFSGYNGNQLKPNKLNARTTGQGFSQNRGSHFFRTYYNNLYSNGLANSMGYPQNVRRIAMVNGSLTGSDEFFNPYIGQSGQMDHFIDNSETGVNIRGFQEVCIIPAYCFDVHIASLEADNMPAYGQNSKVSRFKKGFSDDSKYATNINSRGNMDNVPGGWFPSFGLMIGDLDGTDPLLPDDSFWGGVFLDNVLYGISDFLGNAELDVRTNEHVNSFIPTVSALGFIDPDFNWHEEFDRNLLSCNGNPEIPFDNYYGPKINTMHTSFTEESVDWFKEELSDDNVYPAPTVYLDGNNISGPLLVCHGSQTTYTVPNCTVSVDWWNHSPNLTVISSDDNSVTVEPADPSVKGMGFVTAHFAHDYAKKEFWVGEPEKKNFQISPNGNTQVNINSNSFLHAGPIIPNEQYTWRVNFNGEKADDPGETLPEFPYSNTTTTSKYEEYIPPFAGDQATINWGNVPGVYTVSCMTSNQCGDGEWVEIAITVVDPWRNQCEEMLMSVYPNPVTNGQLNVEMHFPPDSGTCISGPSYYGESINNLVELYDLQGNLKYENYFYEYVFTITEMGLQSGDYILSITSSNGKKGQEIIVVE